MNTKLINLLPEERLRAARRVYFMHLTTVVILVIAIFFIADGVLGAPTYMFLQRKSTELQQTSSALSAALSTRAHNSVKARIKALNKIGRASWRERV